MKTHYVHNQSWGLTDCGIPVNPTGFWKQPLIIVTSAEETTCGNCITARNRREKRQKIASAFRETMNQTRHENTQTT